MDIENSMVVGAQDVYDGCGRGYEDTTFNERVDAYFNYLMSPDGVDELYEHCLDNGSLSLFFSELIKGGYGDSSEFRAEARKLAFIKASDDNGELTI